MNRLFLFFMLWGSANVLAQTNLIPNPSFEQIDIGLAASQWSNSRAAFNDTIQHWFSPTDGSPDIYINNHSTDWIQNAQGLGLDFARTGQTMLGITTFVPPYGKKVHKREYISVKLLNTVKQGKSYQLVFWVKNPKKAFTSSHFGVYFSNNISYVPTERELNVVPQFKIDTILNALTWTKIVYEFTANEDFKYLTLGNFQPDADIQYHWQVKKPSHLAYYYIDDILLTEIETLAVEPITFEMGKNFVLQNIHFEYDKAILMQHSLPELNKLLKYLKANPNYCLDIQGHTDSDGTPTYNLQLSQARAEAVAQFFINNGIAKERLTFQGFGENQPITENTSESGKKLNRRVEFMIK
jgi:OmpA-OmpF porin, OOP family